MIKIGSNSIASLFIGATQIASVYQGTQLIYQSFPRFNTLEVNGSSGTVSGTIPVRKGTYRLTMCGGGGTPGYESYTPQSGSSGCCGGGVTPASDTTYGCGSGAGICCVFTVTENCYMNYSCGAVNTQSSFGTTFICGAGLSGTSRSGGTLSASGYSSATIAANGNAGSTNSFSEAAGGASVLTSLGLEWGRGSSASYAAASGSRTGSVSAMAGYIKLEKIA